MNTKVKQYIFDSNTVPIDLNFQVFLVKEIVFI